MDAPFKALSGTYTANPLKQLYYGTEVVKNHVKSLLPSPDSKAFIITGQSLATKTPLISQLEKLLTPKHHAGTFSNVKQHASIADLDDTIKRIAKDSTIDTIISVGGGSPIDSAKVISYKLHESFHRWLNHITIPTTLSAAECTILAGYTTAKGLKARVSDPNLLPSYVFYDPTFTSYTPQNLFLSSGIRALDHAIECQYHPHATWIPSRVPALNAAGELFRLLPLYKANPQDQNVITGLQLAAYASVGFFGQNVGSALLLSHSMGYALGAPYGIPHGFTSCMTLPPAMELMARQDAENAHNVSMILPYIGEGERSGDDLQDSYKVADAIRSLVADLGLATNLTAWAVNTDQVDIITARSLRLDPADGDQSGSNLLFKGVRELVLGLW